MQRSKRGLVLIGLFAALCVGLCAIVRVPAIGQEADSKKSRLQTLLEERRDILKARADSCEKLYLNGRAEWSEVITSIDDYFDAELELTSDKAARIALLEKKLKSAETNEQLAKAQKAAARASELHVLLATAERLQVEIDIQREQDK